MRLRLWWHLCVLDSRAPEDQGFQPTVDVVDSGLRLPLNVNDNQIYPDMIRLPEASEGWTEMTFFLIQVEGSCRLMHPVLDNQGQHSADAFLDITAKRKIMQEYGQYLSAKYGIFSGRTPTDLSRITLQHTITAARKMEFVLQLREEISMRKEKGRRDDATPDVVKPSFKLACDALESNYVLMKKGLASRFKWFFNLYTQWYALAYVLRCLCNSPCGVETNRAWTLVEELFPRGMSLDGDAAGAQDEHGPTSIWRCLNVLRCQALSLRQRAQLSVAAAGAASQSPRLTSRGDHSTAQHLSDTGVQPRTSTTATAAHGISALPDLGQEFTVDPNQSIFSTLDLSTPDIPFLPDPDWNAVIDGWLNDNGQSNVM